MRFEFYQICIREAVSYYFGRHSRVLLISLSLGDMLVCTEYEVYRRRIENSAHNGFLAFSHCNANMTIFCQRLQVLRAALCTSSLFDGTGLLTRMPYK